jgi:hypothetical protein
MGKYRNFALLSLFLVGKYSIINMIKKNTFIYSSDDFGKPQ